MGPQKRERIVKTGNLPVDMIAGVMHHYKHTHKRVKEIMLSHAWWETFTVFVMDKSPELMTSKDEAVEFRNVVVKKGHRFMKENLEIIFHETQMAEA